MRVDKDIFKYLIKGFYWNKLKKSVLMDKDPNKEFTLEVQIHQAKGAWETAINQMQWADKDMLDAAILYTNACEKRYMSLLQQAKEQGYRAWDKLETNLPSTTKAGLAG